jgi:hypothetical protein
MDPTEGLSVDLGTQSPPDRRLRRSLSPVFFEGRVFGDIVFASGRSGWWSGYFRSGPRLLTLEPCFFSFLLFPFFLFLITHTGARLSTGMEPVGH